MTMPRSAASKLFELEKNIERRVSYYEGVGEHRIASMWLHAGRELLQRIGHPEFGFGGLLCLDLGTRERAFRLMEVLQNEHHFGFMAVSLGYFETLMSCSAATTSSEMPAEELARAGISDGMVRLSVGLTGSLEQRWAQLSDTLDKLD